MKRPRPSPEVVSRLARAAHVCKDREILFGTLVHVAVQEAWRGHGVNRGVPRSSKIVAILDRAERAKPRKAIIILSDWTSAHVAAAWTLLQCTIVPDDLEHWLLNASNDERSDRFNAARRLAVQGSSRFGGFPDAGAPGGTRSNPAFSTFVQMMHHGAKNCGGDFGECNVVEQAKPVKMPIPYAGYEAKRQRKSPKSKKGPVGRFFVALDILRKAKELPSDFIPSGYAVERAYKRAQALWREWENSQLSDK